jgi:hypothetical protein
LGPALGQAEFWGLGLTKVLPTVESVLAIVDLVALALPGFTGLLCFGCRVVLNSSKDLNVTYSHDARGLGPDLDTVAR